MSNPGARSFTQVTITADVWVAEDAPASAWAVADNVRISMKNACDAAVKEIECPDHGVEVVIR